MNLSSLSTIIILIGIIIVFFILIILSIVIKLYSSTRNRYVNKKYDNKFKILERNQNVKVNSNVISNEILAVISAAVYTLYCTENNKNVIIKNIRKKNSSEDSLWRTIGLIENTSNENYKSRF